MNRSCEKLTLVVFVLDQDSLSDQGLGGGAEQNSSVVVWCFMYQRDEEISHKKSS